MESLKDKAIAALKECEARNDVKLADSDEVYMWVYLSENHEVLSVIIDVVNHAPEGMLVQVDNIPEIDSWIDDSRCYQLTYF